MAISEAWNGRADDEDVLKKWLVSKRVNSSRASDDDATLIERVRLDA
jgi:hypothetical protein